MDTIQGLLQERTRKLEISENALKDVEAIDRVLLILGYNKDDANSIPVSNVKIEIGFPKKADKKTQAEWLFKNVFTSAVKSKDIITKYEEVSGLKKQSNFINHIKRLINDNVIRAVKYGNNNMKTYYGLAEWVNGSDFKRDYYPADIEFDQNSTKLITKLIVAGDGKTGQQKDAQTSLL